MCRIFVCGFCCHAGRIVNYVPNVPPTADFSFSTSDMTADFTAGSSDSDGTISHSWDFGDEGSSTAVSPYLCNSRYLRRDPDSDG